MDFYRLLEISPSADTVDIKQAFRRLIARYHPDKVQHLGEEFQAIAEKRSAELTIAYKTLVDPERRAAYDGSLSVRSAASATDRDEVSRNPADVPSYAHAETWPAATASSAELGADNPRVDRAFASLRAGRDAMIRRAALARLDAAIDGACGDSDRTPVAGFDRSYFRRPRLLERSPRPWLLSRFVPRLDAGTLRDIYRDAMRASLGRDIPVCVFALFSQVASDRDMTDAIAAMRLQQNGSRRVTIVPVDAGDWKAWVPTDADPAVRSVAARLRTA